MIETDDDRRETESELARHLDSLTPADAQAILADLSSALFPGGIGDLARLTWRPTITAPHEGVGSADSRLSTAELRYRTLIEQIPAVTFMAVLGDGENDVYVSPYIESLLGFTQKEWLEDPFLWFEQLHPDDRELWVREFARGVRTGGPFRAECRLVARDGRIVWVRGEARLVKDERGRPLFLQGVAFDITESKQAQEQVLHHAVARTEERYRELVEQLGAIFWEAEAHTGRFSFVSRGSERILGFSPARWLESPDFWLDRVHPEDRERVRGEWRLALDEGADARFEFRAVTADGRIVWLSNSIRFPGPSPAEVAPLGVIIDVTERKRWEEQLALTLTRERMARAEAEALNRVGRSVAAELDFAQLGAQIVNVGTELTGAESAAFCRVLEGEHAYELHVRGEGEAPRVRVIARSAHEPLLTGTLGGQTTRVEDLHDPVHGALRSHVLSWPPEVRSFLGVPIVSRSADVIGGLFFGSSKPGAFTEGHERILGAFATQAAIALDNARLYDAAESARKAAEAANRVKDEFLATMSHELRTPVHAVIGWSEILEMGAGDEGLRRRALKAIRDNARAQSQMLEDLFDVSRIVMGKLHLAITRVDLAAVVAESLETVKLASDAKRIRLAVSFGETPVHVLGDADRLRQVVTNLLTNAVKFTPEEGRIDVHVDVSDRTTTISVADSGQGIAPEFLPFVFGRFRQADGSATRRHGGLGLGLSLVRHLTELHGGSVRADSPGEGLGATFTVTLPLDVVGDAGHAEVGSTGTAGADPRSPLAGIQVLVVDDHPDSLDLFVVLLARAGARVAQATSGTDALGLLERRTFDLLICDIAMPRMDGYELIRRVRERRNLNRDIRAVAVTAFARPEDRDRALAAGFQTYFAKPFDIPETLAEIQELVRAG